MQEKILVFAPHPDDELIGCGGTLLKHQKDGHKSIIVYLTYGELGLMEKEKRAKQIRKAEAKGFCKAINAKPIFLGETDLFFKNRLETLKKIIKIIRKEKPTIVFYPHATEDDPTHNQTTELARIACKFCGKNVAYMKEKPWQIKKIFEYEVWTPMVAYDISLDITSVIKQKSQLFSIYKSQLRLMNYREAALSLNRYRGITSGTGEYCEVFKSINK